MKKKSIIYRKIEKKMPSKHNGFNSNPINVRFQFIKACHDLKMDKTRKSITILEIVKIAHLMGL